MNEAEVKDFLASLDASSSSNSSLFNKLAVLRTNHLKNPDLADLFINHGLVERLAQVLQRPNTKLVDITLSILGNLMMEGKARRQFREVKGIPMLARLLGSLQDEGILCRASRTVANLAMEERNATLLNRAGVATFLAKLLEEAKLDKTKQVVVRAIRFLSSNSANKQTVFESSAMRKVALLLQSDDEDLLRAVTKCVAHFTHGCNDAMADQIQGEARTGFQRLSHLVEHHEKRNIWEPALASLVNLSYLDSLRPTLGNVGTINVLVIKLSDSNQLTEKELAHGITALCLYCRESVNRMKMRQCDGLKLLVNILRDPKLANMHDRVVNSILQFAYDDLGLKVLQNEGVIPCLIYFINDFSEKNSEFHDCAVEICEEDDEDEVKKVEISKDTSENSVGETDDSSFAVDDVGIESAVAAAAEEDEKIAPDDPMEGPSTMCTNVVSEKIELENEKEEKENTNECDQVVRFRVNSPSYQAVQDEFENLKRMYSMDLENSRQFDRFQTASGSDSLMHSPDRSPFPWRSPAGYSPNYSSPARSLSRDASPDSSPLAAADMDVSTATPPKYQVNPGMACSFQDKENEENEVDYSPIERFSDDETKEEEDESVNQVLHPTSSTSPPSKRRCLLSVSTSPPSSSMYRSSIFSPSYQPTYGNSPSSPTSSYQTRHNQFVEMMSSPTKMEQDKKKHKKREDDSRISWILQILSRFSQAERPHEHLTNIDTTKALIRYLTSVKDPLWRAGRILMRIFKNIYCVMAVIEQRHVSWFKLVIKGRSTLPDSPCKSCRDLFSLESSLCQNITNMAESGYAEGQSCHILNKGEKERKRSVAVSSALLIRSRKLLRNILISHDGFEIILEILESASKDGEMFSHAVLSISSLSAHLGVVAPDLKLTMKGKGKCLKSKMALSDDITFQLDDGSKVSANKEMVSKSSQVFEAMLEGSFLESKQNIVHLPMCSPTALEVLIHYFYGCRWCPMFENLEVSVLLELVSLSDKYLLSELNKSFSHEIVQRCLKVDQVVSIYEKSIQCEYSVWGVSESLAACTVNYLLVGVMDHEKRVSLFYELMKSNMKSDFIDDVSKLIRPKLMQHN